MVVCWYPLNSNTTKPILRIRCDEQWAWNRMPTTVLSAFIFIHNPNNYNPLLWVAHKPNHNIQYKNIAQYEEKCTFAKVAQGRKKCNKAGGKMFKQQHIFAIWILLHTVFVVVVGVAHSWWLHKPIGHQHIIDCGVFMFVDIILTPQSIANIVDYTWFWDQMLWG